MDLSSAVQVFGDVTDDFSRHLTGVQPLTFDSYSDLLQDRCQPNRDSYHYLAEFHIQAFSPYTSIGFQKQEETSVL